MSDDDDYLPRDLGLAALSTVMALAGVREAGTFPPGPARRVEAPEVYDARVRYQLQPHPRGEHLPAESRSALPAQDREALERAAARRAARAQRKRTKTT